MNRTEQRNLPVDCAKSLAISFVLLIHASADVLRGGAVGSGYWLEGLFWNSLSRGAVPLFLLCSGALFLDPDRPVTTQHIWRRNIPHLLLALAFWALAYQFAPYVTRGLPRADERAGGRTPARGRGSVRADALPCVVRYLSCAPVRAAPALPLRAIRRALPSDRFHTAAGRPVRCGELPYLDAPVPPPMGPPLAGLIWADKCPGSGNLNAGPGRLCLRDEGVVFNRRRGRQNRGSSEGFRGRGRRRCCIPRLRPSRRRRSCPRSS